MCEGLMEDFELFKKEFLPLFTQLCDDKVVNVRISAAKVLASHFERKTVASKDTEIIKLYAKLSKDPSPDIIKIVNREHTFLEDGYSSGSSEHIRSRTSSAISENQTHAEDKPTATPEEKKALNPDELKSPEKEPTEPEIPEAESQNKQETATPEPKEQSAVAEESPAETTETQVAPNPEAPAETTPETAPETTPEQPASEPQTATAAGQSD